ncbi:glycoside hydrolase [Thozetella sp. PMI_491]|nr:glycoside hydrolase [Thozetella sp. PMI_491]
MAQPRRYYEEDLGEREPLDNPNTYSSPHYHPEDDPYQQSPRRQAPQQQQQQYYQQDPYATSPPRVRPPGAHPDSSFERMRAQRRLSREGSATLQTPRAAPGYGGGPSNYRQPDPVSPVSPGRGGNDDQYWGNKQSYSAQRRPAPQSNVTPGADNFGETAAGGMAGIAYSVAEQNARESGMDAMRGPSHPQQAYHQQSQWQQGHPDDGYGQPAPGMRGGNSLREPRLPYVEDPADRAPGVRTPSRSPHAFPSDIYHDDPYQNYSRHPDPHLGVVNPNDIEDDGDEGLEYGRRTNRNSMISLGSSRRGRDNNGATAAAAVAGGAAAGGVMGALASRSGTNGSGGQYAPVQNAETAYQGAGGNPTFQGRAGGYSEKAALSDGQRKGRKTRLVIIGVVVLLILAGIALGVVFGVVLPNRNKSSSNSSSSTGGDNHSGTAAGDTKANGDLDINSAEIKALLNNQNLHKVFPGIDYTAVNTQYPDCLSFPPSQNNVTRDIAVLSQLSNVIRLYGTDCNQTEMTIHAIRQLKMEDTVKIWLGVWQDNNATTNARQLAQMWDILDTYGTTPFKGLIVANEILFREQMTVTQLGTLLSNVRTNLTARGMSLPVATSDLGDKWTQALADVSDYVMANIHPFFGGINAKDAASWTYSFWNNNNGAFFKSDSSKNVISETGWPSQGGMDCGTTAKTNCPDQSVAGIDEMNQFMEDWVCQALTNGTQYFWFEAFDEPWKIQFNTANQNWEDHWGLMDVNRNLKDGVKIPDCGGKTV